MNEESLAATARAWRATKVRRELKDSSGDDANFDEVVGKLKSRSADIHKANGKEHAVELPSSGGSGNSTASPASTSDDDVQIIDEEDLEQIGDLGNEFDDPEGWMREIPDYWDELPDPVAPTPQAWLSHRIKVLSGLLRSIGHPKQPGWPEDRVPERDWQRLYEAEFGKPGLRSEQHAPLPCVGSDLIRELEFQKTFSELAKGPSPEATAAKELRNAPTKENIAQLLDEIDERNLDRLFMPLHTVAMCIKSLQIMSSLPIKQGPDRVAEEYWRLLAANAIRVLFKPLRVELDNQDRSRDMTEKESKDFNAFMDSFGGIEVFLDASTHDPSLANAEPNYHIRGVNESFGKADWTGPHGWSKSAAAQIDPKKNCKSTKGL